MSKIIVDRTCDGCGKTFFVPEHQLKHRPCLYCSKSCANRATTTAREAEKARPLADRFWEKIAGLRLALADIEAKAPERTELPATDKPEPKYKRDNKGRPPAVVEWFKNATPEQKAERARNAITARMAKREERLRAAAAAEAAENSPPRHRSQYPSRHPSPRRHRPCRRRSMNRAGRSQHPLPRPRRRSMALTTHRPTGRGSCSGRSGASTRRSPRPVCRRARSAASPKRSAPSALPKTQAQGPQHDRRLAAWPAADGAAAPAPAVHRRLHGRARHRADLPGDVRRHRPIVALGYIPHPRCLGRARLHPPTPMRARSVEIIRRSDDPPCPVPREESIQAAIRHLRAHALGDEDVQPVVRFLAAHLPPPPPNGTL